MQRTLVVYGDQTLGNSIAGVIMNENMKRLQSKLDKQIEIAKRNADYRHIEKQKRWKKLQRWKKDLERQKKNKLSGMFAMAICMIWYVLPEYIRRCKVNYLNKKKRKARRNYH